MRVFFLLLALCLSGCQSTPKLTKAEKIAQQQAEAVALADKASAELNDRGHRYRDITYQAYLQSLMQRLTTAEERQQYSLQLFLSSNPLVNAFAFPNGDIYIQLGLLTITDNEAELAFVLAHEIEHVLQEHGRITRTQRSKTMVSAHILDLLTFGTGLAYLPAISELSSHSKEMEFQADKAGLERWQRAGFSHPQITEVLARLNNGEVPRDDWFAYRTHPENSERVLALAPLLKPAELSPNPEGFDTEMQRIRLQATGMKLKRRLYFSALRDAAQLSSPWRELFEAEAWLGLAQYPRPAAREKAWLMDEDAEDWQAQIEAKKEQYLQQAQAHVTAVGAESPVYARSQRVRGDVERLLGNNDAARTAYQRFLTLSESPAEQAYVRTLIEKL